MLAAVLSLASAAAAQPEGPWRRLGDGTAWPPAKTRVVDGAGAELVAEGDRLYRVRDGARRELRCTVDGGPGKIRELARAADGTVYLAAERGVFVTSADVESIDPLDRRDGGPDGSPVGIAADGDRLWIATASALGCLDSAELWGRELGAGATPAGPILGVARRGGELWLRTRGGVWARTLAAAPPPALRVISVGGRPFEAATEYEVRGDVPVQLEATADGGPTYRCRRLGHHLWRPLDGAAPTLPALEPGAGGYEIIAVDRELRRSAPVTVRLRVPYPAVYDKKVLVPLALGLSGLVWLAFAWRARRGGRAAVLRASLAAGLLVVVGLQIVAGIVRHGRSWPFVGFSMYTEKYREGSLIYKAVMVGEWPGGRRAEIDPSSAGYTSDGEWQALVPLIHGGVAAQEEFLRAYNERHPWAPIEGFRIQTGRHRLTPAGPVAVAPTVLARYREDR